MSSASQLAGGASENMLGLMLLVSALHGLDFSSLSPSLLATPSHIILKGFKEISDGAQALVNSKTAVRVSSWRFPLKITFLPPRGINRTPAGLMRGGGRSSGRPLHLKQHVDIDNEAFPVFLGFFLLGTGVKRR